jgi:hypothetical protein
MKRGGSEEQKLMSGLEWALDWIQRCGEIPLPEETEDHTMWEWALNLLRELNVS